MNYNRYLFIFIIGISLILSGCINKSDNQSVSKQVKPTVKIQLNSTDTTEKEEGFEPSPYSDILDKDMFTPPDMRSAMKAPIAVEEKLKVEPQKLTITGIVFDGKQYLVSVENLETSEMKYLKADDKLVNYSIVSIDFDMVKAQYKKESKTFRVGDQIPLPETQSLLASKSVVSANVSVSSDSTEINNETISPLPPAGDSLEERLRKRRQQQEEELK